MILGTHTGRIFPYVEDDVPVRIIPLVYKAWHEPGTDLVGLGNMTTAMWRRPTAAFSTESESFLCVNSAGHAVLMAVHKRRGSWLQVDRTLFATGLVYVVCHLLATRKERAP